MINFTTLFDSYYLDKALCMYRSLENVSDDFTLYIFCFDEKSREILLQENLKHAVILSHKNLEADYPELLKLKEERSKAEYCWTCTPASVEYVLKHYDVENCVYIDADLYFFADPQVLIDEVCPKKKEDEGSSVNESTSEKANKGADGRTELHTIITPHRFTNSLKDQRFLRRSGKYCVEFNYFDQSKEARETLTWWRERCFEWCYHLYEPERMGDQKYLMKFPELFQGVHELEHLGGGVAPWNLGQYELVSSDFVSNTELQNDELKVDCNKDCSKDVKAVSELTKLKHKGTTKKSGGITLKEKSTGKEFPLVFYHFQNLRYLSEKKVNASSGTHSKKTKDAIYIPYLKDIESARKHLAKYGVTFSVKKIYSSNKFIAFLQGNVLRFKVKSLSDIYDLEKL